MKTKTIAKIITAKMKAWITTLPTILQQPVKDNLLVSGGCITSMLLREDVNDFDVYIQDMDVLKDIAAHYALPISPVLDGRKRMQYIQEYMTSKNIKCSPEEYLKDSSIFWAGDKSDQDRSIEFLRLKSLKEDQIKYYMPSAGEAVEYNEPVEENSYVPLFYSPNAISLSDDVQIVLRFNGTVENIHKTFDFQHATNYFTFKEGLVLNKEALASIITKELKYQGSYFPVTSIIRMKKFISRGWTIGAGEILKIIFQCSELNLKDPEVLEDQLIGVDVAYFAALIELLTVREPGQEVTYAFLANTIDKIFNQIEGDE